MHNKFFLLAAATLASGICAAQPKPFSIKGKVEGKTDEYIYLFYKDGKQSVSVMDSVLLKNGAFEFNGKLEEVTSAYVLMDKSNQRPPRVLPVFIAPGDMQLAIGYDNFSEGVLSGSPVQEELNRLNKQKASLMAAARKVNQDYEAANKLYINAVKEGKPGQEVNALKDAAEATKDRLQPLMVEMKKVDMDYMNKNPGTFVAAHLLQTGLNEFTYEEAMARYEKLNQEVKNTSLGQNLFKALQSRKRGSPGVMATDFTAKELKGGQLSLSDFRGRYVLIDFWASWCVPCRKGNPHLIALYNKYKDKGFEIIGVASDDGREDKWKEAIAQDKIGIWKHVLRGYKGSNGETASTQIDISKAYDIPTLPTKILVDPTGKIVGRYTGGEEQDAAMDKKLVEVFGK